MDLAPVIEALQATLAPQMRKQAEEKLAEVRYYFSNSVHFINISSFRSAKHPALFLVSFKSFSVNNVIWVLDKLVLLLS